MKKILYYASVIISVNCYAQMPASRFELSKDLQTTPHEECIQYYSKLDATYQTIHLKNFNTSNAGYPLQVVLYCKSKKIDLQQLHQINRIVITVNNGIHSGERNGIDASMLMCKGFCQGQIVNILLSKL